MFTAGRLTTLDNGNFQFINPKIKSKLFKIRFFIFQIINNEVINDTMYLVARREHQCNTFASFVCITSTAFLCQIERTNVICFMKNYHKNCEDNRNIIEDVFSNLIMISTLVITKVMAFKSSLFFNLKAFICWF